MKKLIYILILFVFIIFSWLYREPGKNENSGHKNKIEIIGVKKGILSIAWKGNLLVSFRTGRSII